MKRRGFLGFLGGAAVAGPGMARQAAQAIGIEAMAIAPMAIDGPDNAPPYYGGQSLASEPYDHEKWLRQELAQLAGITLDDRRERMASYTVRMLDPDLATNRSMALWAKVQEQKRRNVDRDIERNRRSLTRELADHLKRQLS